LAATRQDIFIRKVNLSRMPRPALCNPHGKKLGKINDLKTRSIRPDSRATAR